MSKNSKREREIAESSSLKGLMREKNGDFCSFEGEGFLWDF